MPNLFRTPPEKIRLRATYKSRAEENYAWVLEQELRSGLIHSWKYEPITFKLGGDTRYTPDFMVILRDGTIEFREVKGFMRAQARVKIRVAASMFNMFLFKIIWAKRAKRGGFTIEEVRP